MKNFFTKFALIIGAFSISMNAYAGNKDRSGQAGAAELLINPWGQSTGVFGLDASHVRGLQAMKCNIAGMANTDGTEVGLSYGMYLKGSNVNVINGGIAQKVGNFGVLGLNIMSMGFGDITITDYNNPEGGIGSYKPQFINISVGFAKQFSENISGGIAGTFVSEQISNIKANGAAFEAGVQYVTGTRKNFHVGVTLRNVGTNMRFTGGGFAIDAQMPENSEQNMTLEVPTQKFELPTYLNFGASYDFYLDANRLPSEDAKPKHRATVMANFTSNSFNNDYLGAGVEYAFKETFMLRAAYRHEKSIGTEDATTFYTGLAAGATIQQGIGENGPILAIDYSYRPTQRPNNGVHTFSIRLMTRPKSKKAADSEE